MEEAAMSVITIRGQMGSGPAEIGKRVAEKLHADYVDREIIAQVAAQLQRQEDEVVAKEMPPASLLERIAEALQHGFSFDVGVGGAYLPIYEIPLNDRRYGEALVSVVKQLARNSPLVIHGRGSQFILKDHPGAFHVQVVAPLELRLKRVMRELKLDPEAARREISRHENGRREFVKRYFQAEVEDPANYDLVVNTERFSDEAAASMIVAALAIKAQAAGG
jgi:cytidylate kinase